MKIRVWIPGKSGSGYGFAWEYSPEESLDSIFSQLFYKFDFENCDFLIIFKSTSLYEARYI